MAETLSIHSSHASLSARGHSLKNLFFLPVFETGHLPSRVPPHPPASRLDSTNNADREQRMAQSWKRASAEIRESCAHSCVPNVSPPISGAGYRVVLCYEQTRDDEIAKEGEGEWRIPRLFRVAAFGSGRKARFTDSLYFRLDFSPDRLAISSSIVPGDNTFTARNGLPSFLQPPPPSPVSRNFRKFEPIVPSFFFFFLFRARLLTSIDSRVESRAIIGNNRNESISIRCKLARTNSHFGWTDRENRAIFVGGRGGGNARRRIDSSVEKDVARTLTNRKGDVSCVVEREEDLCYEPR